MALRLSEKELSSLSAAMTVMLTPLCYEDGEKWRSAVCASLESLLHSRGASFALAVPNEAFIAGRPDMVDPQQALLPPPDWLLKGLERRRQLGLHVAGFAELHDVEMVKRTSFYNDVVIPNRLFAPLVLAADFNGVPLPAVLGFCYDDEVAASRDLQKNKQLLRLLVPAFIAGVAARVRLGRQKTAISALVESASVAVTVLRLEGAVVEENRSMQTLVGSDPERNRMRAAIKQVAVGVANTVGRAKSIDWEKQSRVCEIRTARARYRITATYLPDGLFDTKGTVLALIDRVPAQSADAGDMVSQFGLTIRETEAAQLMRRGFSNREIAATMSNSLNTARRHAEHVLLKLNVHSRAAVAARLGAVV